MAVWIPTLRQRVFLAIWTIVLSPPPHFSVFIREYTLLASFCQVVQYVQGVGGNIRKCYAVCGCCLLSYGVCTIMVVVVEAVAVTCSYVVIVVAWQIPYACYCMWFTEVYRQRAVVRFLRLVVSQCVAVYDVLCLEACILVAVGSY